MSAVFFTQAWECLLSERSTCLKDDMFGHMIVLMRKTLKTSEAWTGQYLLFMWCKRFTQRSRGEMMVKSLSRLMHPLSQRVQTYNCITQYYRILSGFKLSRLSFCVKKKQSHSWNLKKPLAKPQDLFIIAHSIFKFWAITIPEFKNKYYGHEFGVFPKKYPLWVPLWNATPVWSSRPSHSHTNICLT